MYYHKDTTALTRTKLNEIVKFSIDDPHLTACNFMVDFGKATKFSISVAES